MGKKDFGSGFLDIESQLPHPNLTTGLLGIFSSVNWQFCKSNDKLQLVFYEIILYNNSSGFLVRTSGMIIIVTNLDNVSSLRLFKKYISIFEFKATFQKYGFF